MFSEHLRSLTSDLFLSLVLKPVSQPARFVQQNAIIIRAVQLWTGHLKHGHGLTTLCKYNPLHSLFLYIANEISLKIFICYICTNCTTQSENHMTRFD